MGDTRFMLRLLVTLVLVAGALVLADLGVTLVAEQRAGAQVSGVLNAPADVDLHGWPVSVYLVQGHVPRADITATAVPLEGGAQIDRLEVTLERVRIRWRDLQGPTDRLPPADVGRFSAELDREAVQELLGLPEQIVGVELADGYLVINLVDLVELEADVEADEGQLVIVPRADVADLFGAARIPVDLSDQPGQPAVEGARVTPEALVVEGILREVNG